MGTGFSCGRLEGCPGRGSALLPPPGGMGNLPPLPANLLGWLSRPCPPGKPGPELSQTSARRRGSTADLGAEAGAEPPRPGPVRGPGSLVAGLPGLCVGSWQEACAPNGHVGELLHSVLGLPRGEDLRPEGDLRWCGVGLGSEDPPEPCLSLAAGDCGGFHRDGVEQGPLCSQVAVLGPSLREMQVCPPPGRTPACGAEGGGTGWVVGLFGPEGLVVAVGGREGRP